MRRRPLAGELGIFGWLILPVFAVVLGLMLVNLPIRLGAQPIPMPILPLIVVFLWAMYRPSPYAGVFVFMLGLLQDLLTFSAFGYWALINLAVYVCVAATRRGFIGRPPLAIWITFAGVAVLAGLLGWMVGALRGDLVPVQLMFAQLLATVLIYPWVAKVLSGMQGVAVEFHREDGF